MGEIRLECGEANVDLKRLRASQLKLAVDHDTSSAPIGHVVRLTPTGEAVTGQAELVETESTRARQSSRREQWPKSRAVASAL